MRDRGPAVRVREGEGSTHNIEMMQLSTYSVRDMCVHVLYMYHDF